MARLSEPGHRRPVPRGQIIVLAVVLVAVVFALWAITSGAIRFLDTDDGDGTKSPAAPVRASAQPTVGVTQPVTDGDLEMRLTSVRSSGPRDLTVTLTVRNRTSAFSSFYGENQQVISSENRTVRSGVQLISLQPRESAPVTLRFTLPEDFRAAELDLHSTPSSPGARIPLG